MNEEDDTIPVVLRVVHGNYEGKFEYKSSKGHNLVPEGGYDSG
jgi:hypothetical protein